MSSAIEQAVASIADLEEISILEDPYRDAAESKWILKIQLAPEGLDDHPDIPSETEWFFHLDENYPWGNIQLYPAKENGISATFPHQHINLRGDRDERWRTGDICVARYGRKLGRSGATAEPDAAGERLRWYVQRAIEWLKAASKGELRQSGDPYEIPDFNTRSSPNHTVAFNERYDELETWESAYGEWGIVDFASVAEPSNMFFTTRFRGSEEDILSEPDWGDYLNAEKSAEFSGVWLLLEETPFEPPWEAPETWADFASVLEDSQIDVFALLSAAKSLLEDEETKIILIGFPIPEEVDGSTSVVHWQPVEILEFADPSEMPGSHRPTARGKQRIERLDKIRKQIRWLDSENWAHEQLSRRGSLPDELVNSKILIVGAGALGSTLAENLVRAGCHHVAVMDGEQVKIGNMARHMLPVQDVGENKAKALANRLRSLSPNVTIDYLAEDFPPSESSEAVADVEVVIDCTASESVLHSLQRFDWTDPILFVTASMGRRANRLFFFAAYSYSFPHERFREEYRPWDLQEQVEWEEGEDAVPERVGCWHPASVIRMDRVSMWGGIVSRLLSHYHDMSVGDTVFKALETDSDDLTMVAPAGRPFQDVSTWVSTESDLEIEIPQECLTRMQELCTAAGEVETGGILTGVYETPTKARVITVDDPPRDSTQTATSFHRGTEEVDEWLQEARDSLGIRYLGEWHYHPGGSSEPSAPDEREMADIAENEDYACPDPILIVVGANSEHSLSPVPYVFHRGISNERLRQPKSCSNPIDSQNGGNSI